MNRILWEDWDIEPGSNQAPSLASYVSEGTEINLSDLSSYTEEKRIITLPKSQGCCGPSVVTQLVGVQ